MYQANKKRKNIFRNKKKLEPFHNDFWFVDNENVKRVDKKSFEQHLIYVVYFYRVTIQIMIDYARHVSGELLQKFYWQEM